MTRRYTLSILIWHLELREKGIDVPFQNIYFLTRRGLERFLKRHEEEFTNYSLSYGVEQLWFW